MIIFVRIFSQRYISLTTLDLFKQNFMTLGTLTVFRSKSTHKFDNQIVKRSIPKYPHIFTSQLRQAIDIIDRDRKMKIAQYYIHYQTVRTTAIVYSLTS